MAESCASNSTHGRCLKHLFFLVCSSTFKSSNYHWSDHSLYLPTYILIVLVAFSLEVGKIKLLVNIHLKSMGGFTEITHDSRLQTLPVWFFRTRYTCDPCMVFFFLGQDTPVILVWVFFLGLGTPVIKLGKGYPHLCMIKGMCPIRWV